MNIEDRKNKVAGLEAIKNKALEMAKDGKDSLEVRDFVTNAKNDEKTTLICLRCRYCEKMTA